MPALVGKWISQSTHLDASSNYFKVTKCDYIGSIENVDYFVPLRSGVQF
jgi:hypothetical protein